MSNFSVSGAYITQSQQSLCRVGEDPVFNSLNVSISYSNDDGVLIYSISLNDTVMTVTSSSVVNMINGDIDLYIGGIPTTGMRGGREGGRGLVEVKHIFFQFFSFSFFRIVFKRSGLFFISDKRYYWPPSKIHWVFTASDPHIIFRR